MTAMTVLDPLRAPRTAAPSGGAASPSAPGEPAYSRGWLVAALGVAGLSIGCAAVSIVLQLVHGIVPDPVTYWLVDVVCAVLYGVVVVLLLPRTRHPVAWVMVLAAIGSGVTALANQYVRLEVAHPEVPSGDLVWFAAAPLWVLGAYGTLAVLPWLVSSGRPHVLTRATGALGWAAVVTTAVIAATLKPPPGSARSNPFEVPWEAWQETAYRIGPWPPKICLALGVLGVGRLAVLWWRRRGTAERGYAWLLLGQVLLVGALAITIVGPMHPGVFLRQLSGASLLAAQVFLPIALLVVVLGQRLWRIEVAVNRAAVWILLTAAAAGIYVAAIWVAADLLPVSNEAAGLGATVLLALAAQPVRHWLQRRVDKLVYGGDGDPVSMLARLGEQLRGNRETDPLPALADSLRSGLRLGLVQIVARHPGIEAASGDPQLAAHDRSVVIPLVVDRRHVGDLTMAAPAGQRLDLRTVRVVRHLSDLIAVTLDLEEKNRRLAAVSERLGEVRHQERRMLRRELHDGMGPALAGVGLGLAAARRRLHHDPQATDVLLAELEGEIARRTDDVRQFARSLLPAQLDDGDLAAALGVLATRFRSVGIAVDIDCDGLDAIDTRRQIAVYHVAAEALINAHRHGQAGHVTITVRGDGGDGGDEVSLEVVDDGVGMVPGSPPGVGLQSMRERSDEFGGRLSVVPRPDGPGTRVHLVLPGKAGG